MKQAAKKQGEDTLPKTNKLYVGGLFSRRAASCRDENSMISIFGPLNFFLDTIPFHTTVYRYWAFERWLSFEWISSENLFLGIHWSVHKPQAFKNTLWKRPSSRYLEDFFSTLKSKQKKMGGLWRYSCEKKSTSVVHDFRTNQIIYVYLSESQQPFDSLKPRSGWAQAPSRQLADLELKFNHQTSLSLSERITYQRLSDVFVKWFDGSWCVFWIFVSTQMQKNNQLHHSFCKTKNSLQQSNGFLAIQSVLPWAFQQFWMIFFKLLVVRWLAWIYQFFVESRKKNHSFGAYKPWKSKILNPTMEVWKFFFAFFNWVIFGFKTLLFRGEELPELPFQASRICFLILSGIQEKNSWLRKTNKQFEE